MEQGQGTTLQTAPSLLYREGPKRLTDGYVHTPGSSEAGLSVSTGLVLILVLSAKCSMVLSKYTSLSALLQIKQLNQFLAY